MSDSLTRALVRRKRMIYQRHYKRRLRFELKVKRIRETFARIEALAEKLIDESLR